ncbi:MAG: M28 family peptidase [Chitinophagaceae bacterium]|nr:MAG: M28 family peptidase [Chitinophagaceae bacterium]
MISFAKYSLFVAAVFFHFQSNILAQATDTIRENEVQRIMHVLAGDSLKGRGNGSDDLLKAGRFIDEEFKHAGLQNLRGFPGYYLPFRPFGGSRRVNSDQLTWNGKKLSSDEFIYLHPVPGNYPAKSMADFTIIKIDSFFTKDIFLKYKDVGKDLLLWSNQPQPDKENYFPPVFDMPEEGLQHNLLMVCANKPPDSLALTGLKSYYEHVEYNVVGMLRGKSKPEEIILFSAHYDHEGIFKRGKRKDSIMNGANDNASGTTALLMLAKYFALRNDNERTILFCAFAGEELGLLGSKDFSKYIPPDNIVAGINIEMIGVPQYGKNGIFITGSDQSSLPAILNAGFTATPLKLKKGPAEHKQLFKRSDNYSFVKKGVPAHTIMSSDDDDKCYHQPCDELKRIDFQHMTTVIRAIAVATRSLINGTETPTRIGEQAEDDDEPLQ